MGEIMSEEASAPQEVQQEVTEAVEEKQPTEIKEESKVQDTGVRRIKVDGKYIDVKLEDLEKSYGLEKSSRAKFEEASVLRKEVDAFLELMHKGELGNLKNIVPEEKLLGFAEKLLREKVEWEETPKEQKDRIVAERERDKYKAKLTRYEEEAKQHKMAQMNDKVAQELDSEISEVIGQLQSSYGSIVKSPEFVQDVARIMLAQLSKGAENVNSKKAAELAVKGWQKRLGTYVNNISPDDLSKHLTKDQMNKIRKQELSETMDQLSKPLHSKKGKVSRKKRGKRNVDDFFATIEKKIG